jgi:hypothetical protein
MTSGVVSNTTKAETKKQLKTVFVLILIIATFATGIWTGIYYKEKTIVIPEPVIVEKEIVKEVMHYVERSKTETKDFLLHLNPDVDPALAIIIADVIDEMSKKYQLPRKLVCSIIKKESNINPFAKSSVGAVGLMQVMPKIHKDKIGDRNLWHIRNNVDVGCAVFREYLDLEKGNMFKTFHRYLSKNATKDQINKYAGGIYEYWAKLEMFDYLSIAERQANTNGIGTIEKEEEIKPDPPIEMEKEDVSP